MNQKFLTRLKFVTTWSLTAALVNCTPSRVTSLPESASTQTAKQEGFRRMKLGDFKITIISDGTAVRDATELITKVSAQDVRELVALNYREPKMELSINTFLIDTGSRQILIDAGAGDLFSPEGGLLSENMRAAGYAPEKIDVVVITHIHADHSGGLVRGGARVFPRAQIYVPEADYKLFMDKDAERRAPEKQKHIFTDAQKCLGPYVTAGQVHTFGWNVEVVGGLRSVAAPGHTPGHSYLSIESGGEKMMVLGDTVHVAEVQFPRPEAAVILDADQDAAVAQRRRGLAEAARSGYWVAFEHVSFPGVGHVRSVADGFVWLPMPYSVKR